MNKLDININRIKQPSQCCIYCGKSYVKRKNLDTHITICELLQKSKKSSLLIEDDEHPIPSQYKLFQMVIELGKKYNKLEEKMEEMQKWVVKKKKKINMIEWLNTNIHPNILFEKLIDKVIVTDKDIEFLLNNSFYDSLNELFSKTIYNLNETESPIFAFTEKNNLFYIYDTSEKWIELSRENLTKFMNKVHMKFIKAFSEWKKTNIEEVKKNDRFATTCDKTLVKLMSVVFNVESTFNKVSSILYNHIKKDFKEIIELEIDF
jgi:hypothetical protein